MKRIYLGGLVASILAASAMAAMPTGADAAPQIKLASSQDARALARAAATDLITSKAPALKISSYDRFVAKPVVSFEGIQYAAYERTYRGIPVVGGDFVVVTDKSGNVITTSVAQTRKIDLASVTPKFGKDRASQVAQGRLDTVDSVEGTRLVVWQKGASHLAWETTVVGTAYGEVSRQSVYVDAISGKVLGSKEHVVDGNGTAAYSGPNPLHIDTTLSGSTYYMQDPNNSTLKCQDNSNSTTFSGTDDNWGNGDASNKETGCVDGLFAIETENKMLSSWLGRNGMDGSGGWVPLRVGLNDVNAYYDGTQVKIGHNQDSTPKWISSIDVVAHEFGHGIDDHTPGGISGSGTQEFIADVFGAATEGYANEGASYDPPDYTVGEEVNLVGQGPIRYMYKPSLAGDPDCYSSSIPSTEVHAAAGPGNHWFYLLAEGTNPTNGQPTSPTCNGSSNLVGIGVQKATKILYGAMQMKTSSASYLKYRTWTLTAAKNQDSTCGLFNKTKAAWDAVSVPAQTGDPTCSSTGGVTVNNPGNKSGTVGTAISSFTVTASGGTAPCGHLQRDRHRQGLGQRHRQHVVHLHHQRHRRHLHRGTEARQPRLRVGQHGVVLDQRRDRSVRVAGADPLGHLGRVAGRLRLLAHRHAVAVGDDPERVQRDAVVLPAHRLVGDHHVHGVRQADGEDRVDDPGDVLEPQQGLGLLAEVVQRVLVGRADGDGLVQWCGGLLAADVLRHRRHRTQRELRGVTTRNRTLLPDVGKC